MVDGGGLLSRCRGFSLTLGSNPSLSVKLRLAVLDADKRRFNQVRYFLMDYNFLIKAAKESLKHAYAPYSMFRVGAAVLTRKGRVFTGCNIENASYGLTVCAERTALFNAVSAGHRNFTAIAVVTSGKSIAFPCGACLQVLSEFAPDIKIVLFASAGGKIVTRRLKELLPAPFSMQNR